MERKECPGELFLSPVFGTAEGEHTPQGSATKNTAQLCNAPSAPSKSVEKPDESAVIFQELHKLFWKAQIIPEPKE